MLEIWKRFNSEGIRDRFTVPFANLDFPIDKIHIQSYQYKRCVHVVNDVLIKFKFKNKDTRMTLVEALPMSS